MNIFGCWLSNIFFTLKRVVPYHTREELGRKAFKTWCRMARSGESMRTEEAVKKYLSKNDQKEYFKAVASLNENHNKEMDWLKKHNSKKYSWLMKLREKNEIKKR